ncbi:hypothetical protein SAY86_026394 [Trapa natans]|uniref:Uncharacterized protein n=1 Tax=Trapa natans TaxID=22666 RepID=A0AAN7QET5_TRANT|nr:hypothetical protein SAY86_026394 [Trapa natans]
MLGLVGKNESNGVGMRFENYFSLTLKISKVDGKLVKYGMNISYIFLGNVHSILIKMKIIESELTLPTFVALLAINTFKNLIPIPFLSYLPTKQELTVIT